MNIKPDKYKIFINTGIILLLVSVVAFLLYLSGVKQRALSFALGGVFSSGNILLLTIGLAWFMERGVRKLPAYIILILKSAFFYGGVYFAVRMAGVEPVGFLSGFTVFTALLLLMSFAGRRQLKNARA
ncbi:MAG TPA: hypothetical protein VII00_06380 [bacterium]